MNKIFKKIGYLFSMIFVLLLAVSCGNSAKDSEVPVLKVINIGNGKPKNYDSWVKKVNDYIEPKIGAKVEVETISWGDWDSRRSVISTSNEPFDVLFGNLNVYYSDVVTGLYLDLDDLLKEKEFQPLYNIMPQKYWDGVKVNGKIYGVPTYKDSSVTQYFIFDEKLVKDLNVDITKFKTLPDLDGFLRAATKKLGKPAYFLTAQGADQIFYDFDRFGLGFNVLGVRVDDKDMKVVNMLEQPDIVKDLTYLYQWHKDGIINPDAATATEHPKYRPFFIEQGWPLAAKTVWGPGNGSPVVLQQYGPTIVSNGTIQGSINSISSSSENPKKALAFLQLLNLDTKLRDMFAYGEEGVNFKYVDKYGEKRVHRNDDDPWPMAAYAQAQFFTMSLPDDVKENQWDQVKKLNEQATPSVLLGFTFDPKPVQDEIANVNAVYNKYKSELLTGVRDPKVEVPMILKEMKAAGLDKIQAEAQKQIDAFKSSQK